jgi:diguanylate cyclase (GGDEF)-like protein
VKELENRLNRDYLTGLYNRRFFMDRFREELDWVSRYKEPLSLLLLDIDHFKKVNDQYGHICGDEILRQVAQKVLSVVGLEATAGRFGGEEFIVLLPNVPMEEAMAMAERLRAEIQNNLFDCSCNDTSVNLTVTVSLGVTTCNSADGLTLDQMIAQTDDALYAAKEGGRNRVVAHRVSEPMISAV